MIVVDPAAARDLQKNVLGYDKRVERGLCGLARAASYDHKLVGAWLRLARKTIGSMEAPASEVEASSHVERATRSLPLMFELLVQLGEGGVTACGFRTAGRVRAAVLDTAKNMLVSSLEFLLAAGFSQADASIVPLAFRHAFAKLSHVGGDSGLVAPMLLGVVPRGEHVRAQVLFNTRFGNPHGHEHSLRAMLDLTDLGWPSFVRDLYETVYDETTRFYGAGFDLEPGVKPRGLVYLLFERSQLAELRERLGELARRAPAGLTVDPAPALEGLELVHEHFAAERLSSQIELGISLQGAKAPRFKFSVMFERCPKSAALASLTRSCGAGAEALLDAIKTIRGDVVAPAVVKNPLHAVAVQSVPGKPPRFDFVLEPLL